MTPKTVNFAIKKSVILIQSKKGSHIDFVFDAEMHIDHKFSEIDHVTPLFKFFLVVHLQTHSGLFLWHNVTFSLF